MSEELVKDAEIKPKTRKSRTKKAAEGTPVDNVVIEEVKETVVNDDGQKVITGAPKGPRAPRASNVKAKDDGVIGSNAADYALQNAPKATDKAPKKEQDPDKVALWSEKNIRWAAIGELAKGYNIVTKEDAEKWLSLKGIRTATPKEVATYYGK